MYVTREGIMLKYIIVGATLYYFFGPVALYLAAKVGVTIFCAWAFLAIFD